MNDRSDPNQALQMKRLGAVAAAALLAGVLLHQALPTSSVRAADVERAVLAPAAQLADAKSEVPGSVPPTASTPSAPPKNTGRQSNDSPVREVMGMTIAIVAIVMGCGIAMLGVWSEHKKRLTLMQLCHQERIAALEKGLELPPFPQEQADAPEKPGTGLKGGLIWLALGIGLGLFLGFQAKPAYHPALSAIPIALGLAYLAYYAIGGRKLESPNK